ncbi:hypothetical protein DFH08DRAFT_872063 [Mycena albidolilacea]|uniref:Uncharacterized protein n=1 Tax=Mycena albidolilacea TaxID=1033008 RepID=A0AAD6ZWW0_9AGAR|nr:hypothetical protein DFH08DRAFT_872063 [Mycena albidolilacea]
MSRSPTQTHHNFRPLPPTRLALVVPPPLLLPSISIFPGQINLKHLRFRARVKLLVRAAPTQRDRDSPDVARRSSPDARAEVDRDGDGGEDEDSGGNRVLVKRRVTLVHVVVHCGSFLVVGFVSATSFRRTGFPSSSPIRIVC